MTYYQTDDTGELLTGPIEAREDARTPGHFFLPAGGVTTAPPEIPNDHVARWTGEAWETVEDHRGSAGWVDGGPVAITELGPLPVGWRADAPASADPSPRTRARDALAAQWATLPAWIRGPYSHRFSETVRLLDRGDDEAVAALVQYAGALAAFSPEQVDAFELIRIELLAAVQALPKD